MKYESVILDIDGTLWDSRELVAKAYNAQLCSEGQHHRQVNAERLLTLFGKTMDVIADEMFPDLPPEERYPMMDRCIESEHRYLHQYASIEYAYPGIVETVAALSKKHRLFLVSNSPKGYPQVVAEKLGIAPFITGYLSYGDTGTTKDLTIKRLMEEHNITDAVYVGDTQGDENASRGAGIDFIFCDYGFGTAEEYIARIHSFPELLNL